MDPSTDAATTQDASIAQERDHNREPQTLSVSRSLGISVSPSLCSSVSLSSLALSVSVTEDELLQELNGNMPTGEGGLNRRVLSLARKLKAIPLVAQADAEMLKEIVGRWHCVAYPVGKKDFDDTWADFTYAWKLVKYAEGEGPLVEIMRSADAAPMPECASQYDSESTRRLVKLCRELQKVAGNAPFFLGCRPAGHLLGINHVIASKRLNMLVTDGVLELIEPGTTGKASRYRYVADRVVGENGTSPETGRGGAQE